MVHADYLFLMTDVDCLYTANPRTRPDALPIEVVTDPSTLVIDVSSAGSALGTGGMSTKLVAARLATSAGVTTIITRSSKPGNVHEIVSYLQALKTVPAAAAAASAPTEELIADPTPATPLPKPPLHTRFLPATARIRDRSFWLLHGLAPHGTVFIDGGAHRALRRRAGLLPAGVVAVEGPFAQQEAVRLVVVSREGSGRRTPSPGSSAAPSVPGTPGVALTNGGLGGYESVCEVLDGAARAAGPMVPEGREVGRALVNYSSAELARIKGLQSAEIRRVLGYAESEYVALRENVSLLGGADLGKGM